MATIKEKRKNKNLPIPSAAKMQNGWQSDTLLWKCTTGQPFLTVLEVSYNIDHTFI